MVSQNNPTSLKPTSHFNVRKTPYKVEFRIEILFNFTCVFNASKTQMCQDSNIPAEHLAYKKLMQKAGGRKPH